MKSTARKQNFIHGAAILTIGVVIMKILGAIYKIPLGSILGDYGYGIFIATYTVYNIFFTLSTSGMPVALSRLIAEADANGRKKQEEKTFRAALLTFAVIGLFFSLIMFFGNSWIAEHYLKKPEAALSVRAMSPAILLVCLVSAYRGYCQGNGNMIPTTVDEVLEVLFKVISGLLISGLLVKAGHELPDASAGAILGVSIGSVVSLGYMVLYRRKNYGELSAPYTSENRGHAADPTEDRHEEREHHAGARGHHADSRTSSAETHGRHEASGGNSVSSASHYAPGVHGRHEASGNDTVSHGGAASGLRKAAERDGTTHTIANIAGNSGLRKASGQGGTMHSALAGTDVSTPRSPADHADAADSTGQIIRSILKIGIPISLGASIMAILTSFDPGICQSRLEAAGFSEYNAGVLYGIYAKVQTLFNLPAAFMTPLTIAIVPAVAAARARGDHEEASRNSGDAMRIASVISMPMGMGLAVLSYPIVNVLYPNSNESGPGLLTIMGIASFFVCIVLMENAILQASGQERLPMYAMVSGSVVKIIINYIIIAIPSINIYGAPVGTLIGYLWMAVMDFVFIRRKLGMRPHLLSVFGKPFLCSLVMGVLALGVYSLLGAVLGTESKLAMLICMAAAMLAAVVIYVAAVVFTRSITNDDLKLIPGGEKVGRLLRMR